MSRNRSLLEMVLEDYDQTGILEDTKIYEKIDELLYEDIKDTLRAVVLESAIPDYEKVEQIAKIEKTAITPRHLRNYLTTHVQPVLEMTGLTSFDTTYPVFVEAPVFEAVHGLNYINKGKFKTLKGLVEYHDMIFDNYDSDTSSKKSVIESYFRNIFNHWGITDNNEKKRIISKAKRYLKEYGANNVLWDPMEAHLIVMMAETVIPFSFRSTDSNKPKTQPQKPSASDISYYQTGQPTPPQPQQSENEEPKVKPEDAQGVIQRMWNGIVQAWSTGWDYARSAGSSVKKFLVGDEKTEGLWQRLQNIDKTKAGFIIGAGLLALIAGYIWKKRKEQCAGLPPDKRRQCLIGAADAAIAGLRAQLRNCPKTTNPIKCKENIEKAIRTWQEKKRTL